MKNKQRLTHYREEVSIYREHYKPSFNVFRVFKSILGVFISGSGSVAHSYIPSEKKRMK
jgi:hypothetical protein